MTLLGGRSFKSVIKSRVRVQRDPLTLKSPLEEETGTDGHRERLHWSWEDSTHKLGKGPLQGLAQMTSWVWVSSPEMREKSCVVLQLWWWNQDSLWDQGPARAAHTGASLCSFLNCCFSGLNMDDHHHTATQNGGQSAPSLATLSLCSRSHFLVRAIVSSQLVTGRADQHLPWFLKNTAPGGAKSPLSCVKMDSMTWQGLFLAHGSGHSYKNKLMVKANGKRLINIGLQKATL